MSVRVKVPYFDSEVIRGTNNSPGIAGHCIDCSSMSRQSSDQSTTAAGERESQETWFSGDFLTCVSSSI